MTRDQAVEVCAANQRGEKVPASDLLEAALALALCKRRKLRPRALPDAEQDRIDNSLGMRCMARKGAAA